MGDDRDPGLDALLSLDGQAYVVDPVEGYWVKIEARRVEPTEERPHGVRYSLTLHAADGERLVGFDNAHAPPSRKRSGTLDHRHRLGNVRAYQYRDAASLLTDFYAEAKAVLAERGVKQ